MEYETVHSDRQVYEKFVNIQEILHVPVCDAGKQDKFSGSGGQ